MKLYNIWIWGVGYKKKCYFKLIFLYKCLISQDFFHYYNKYEQKDLKIGQTIKTNSFWHTKKLFQIVEVYS